MNLNSIHSYKKKGKISKQTITEGKQPQQQASSLSLRNKRYLQIQSITNNNTKNNHPSSKTVPLIPQLAPSRNLSTVQQLIKAEQDQEIMNILRSKFSDQIPDEISGLVLNNKFKAQNLNMNINIHYNGGNGKKEKVKGINQDGFVMKKNFKYSHQQQQQFATINPFKDQTYNLFTKPYSSSLSRNQKFKSFLNQTYHKQQHQTLLPTYQHIYSKRPHFPKPKRVKTQKTKPSKSLNSRYFDQPHLSSLNSTVNPFHKNQYRNVDRYETQKQAETIDLEMKEKYKSLDLRGMQFENKQNVKKSLQTSQQNRQRMNTQVNALENGQKKLSTKPRRILTQQGPKDEKKRVYQSIDFANYRTNLNNLKNSTQKTQSKHTARNTDLNKNKLHANSKKIKNSGFQTIKNQGLGKYRYHEENPMKDDRKSSKRFLLSEEKGKKSHSLNEIHKRGRYDDIKDEQMPVGVKSFKYQNSKVNEKAPIFENQMMRKEKYDQKELRKEIKKITGYVIEKRRLESKCLVMRLIRKRCSVAEQDNKISKFQNNYQKQLKQVQAQLANLQAQTKICLSQNKQIAVKIIIKDITESLKQVCTLPSVNVQDKKIGLQIESKLLLALQKEKNIRMKQQAGYHVYHKTEEGLVGIESKLLVRALILMNKIGNEVDQKKKNKQEKEMNNNQEDLKLINETIFRLKYLLSLQFLNLISSYQSNDTFNNKTLQLSFNLLQTFHSFQQSSSSLNHSKSQQFLSQSLIASTCLFSLIKEWNKVSLKMSKLNHQIGGHSAFVEVQLWRESERHDQRVMLAVGNEQFNQLIQLIRQIGQNNSRFNHINNNKLSETLINLLLTAAKSFKKTKQNNQSYISDQISLCNQIETQISKYVQAFQADLNQTSIKENPSNYHLANGQIAILIEIKLIELYLKRKLILVEIKDKNHQKIPLSIDQYISTWQEVNTIIDQSELNISYFINHQQSSLQISQQISLISTFMSIPYLILYNQQIWQHFVFNTYIQTCYFVQKGQFILLKCFSLYMKKDYYQCQILIEESLSKIDHIYLIKLLSLSIAIKVRSNSFYQAYHQLQRFPYYGIFLDKIDLTEIIAEHESKHGTNPDKYGLSIGQRMKETADRYFIQLKCLELFVTGVVLLMKRKLQEGLKLLNQAMEIVEFVLKTDNLRKNINQKASLKNNNHNQSSQQQQHIVPQFITLIHNIINSYLAYSHYCLNNLEKTQQCLTKQQQLIQNQQSFTLQPYTVNFSTTINYNLLLCQGLKQLKSKNYNLSVVKLKQCLKILNKPQPHAYLALVYYRMWVAQHQQGQQSQVQGILQDLYIHLSFACSLVEQMNNNFSSSIFYLRSLYYTWHSKLDLALLDIDQSIDKAEQNYPKHFYLRALILALSQNYKQAINQTSIAITINQKDYEAYLLRSRCCQIQGDQNQAFIDLQAYISLRPDDMQIHKYAGHLLFQNGAFQDALSAYQQGDINLFNKSISEEDFHVFLTKSKTYFLLGNFKHAAEEMKMVVQIKPKQSAYHFDFQMMKWLNETVEVFENDYLPDEQDSVGNHSFREKLSDKLKEIIDIYGLNTVKQSQQSLNSSPSNPFISSGKIFKQVQMHLFKFVLLFYLKNYKQSLQQLQQCISLKQSTFARQKSTHPNSHPFEEFEQEENEKQLFINQMRYNMVLVLLKMRKFTEAEKELAKCKVEVSSKGYKEWKRLMWLINGRGKDVTVNQQQEQQNYIRVFSDKNKLSKFFPDLQFSFQSQNYSLIKLMKACLPYPKVQPPQISPKFDIQLLNRFSEDDIEKKPQAPWIKNQKNSIKFTEEIKTFSRLDIDYSEAEEKRVKKTLGKGTKGEESSVADDANCEEFDGEEVMIKKRSSRFGSKLVRNRKSHQDNSKGSSSISSSYQHADIHKLLKLDESVQMKLRKLIK